MAFLLLAGAAQAQSVVDAGSTPGPMGPQGPAGPASTVAGPKGDPGAAGVGYASALVNAAGHLIVSKTDGTTLDVGAVVGPTGPAGVGIKGDKGDVGPAGASVVGPQGVAGVAGPAGANGIVPFYGPAGLITGIKCWQGATTTTAGGAWTVGYANAGFTAVPNVETQAISPSSALAGLLFSTMTMPTTTTASGVTALAGVGGLGGAGATVMVRACGS